MALSESRIIVKANNWDAERQQVPIRSSFAEGCNDFAKVLE